MHTKQEVVVYVTPHLWSPDLTPPLAEPGAFKDRPEGERFTPLERLRRQ